MSRELKWAERRGYARGYAAARRGSRTTEAAEQEQSLAAPPKLPPQRGRWQARLSIVGNYKPEVAVGGHIETRQELYHFLGALDILAEALGAASGMQLREDAQAAEGEALQPDPQGDAQ